MDMKRKDILELDRIFNELKKYGNTKFKYNIIINLNIVRPHVLELEALNKEARLVISEFEKDRTELVLKIGKKAEDNLVFIDPNDAETIKIFNEEIVKIADKHRDSLEEYDKRIEALKRIHEEDFEHDLVLKTISIDDFPPEGISTEQLEFLVRCNVIV